MKYDNFATIHVASNVEVLSLDVTSKLTVKGDFFHPNKIIRVLSFELAYNSTRYGYELVD